MLNVSNDYKVALTYPRQIDAKIVIGNTILTSDDINSIKRSFNTTLFKSVMKELKVDSNVDIAKDTIINPQFGIYVNNAFEYLSLGYYKAINGSNSNEDTKSYEITCYDKIVESMVEYGLTSSDISYPCSVRDLFVAIFTKLGWTTSGIPATFTNSTSLIEEDVYSNVNMTYRSVLDELCTISCMFLVEKNNIPTLIQKTTTNEIIDEEYMSDTNVSIKQNVFFNSLVFSRAAGTDNIVRKDDESIETNGLHEYKVSDLQILSLNWRDNFIDEMWNYLKDFSYYAFDINTIGITYLEPIDEFTLSIFGTEYGTILLNSDLTISNGLNEKIYASEISETTTEYQYSSNTDRKINQTNLTVDKQNQIIEGLVSTTKIISNEIEGTGSIQLDKAYKGTLHYLSIKRNIQPLTPSNILSPSDDLYIIEPILLVDDVEYKLDIDYLNYIDDENCDEFVYEEGKCKIIRRVNVVEPFEETRNDILIEVNSNSTLQMKYYNNAKLKTSYLIQNDYTNTFAPTVDLVAKINLSPGQATIEANKISLAGKTIDLTSDNIVINSTNFKLDKDGNMIANSGTFGGTISTGEDCVVGNDLRVGTNQSEEGRDTKNVYLSENTFLRRTILANHEWAILNAPMLSSNIKDENNDDYEWLQADYGKVQISNPYMVSLSTQSQGIYVYNQNISMTSQPIINSDRRLKTEIRHVDTSWIDDLKVKEFEYKTNIGKKQIGLIAQDYENKDYAKYFLMKKSDGYYGINYGNITNALIDYCQRLNKRVEELENKIKEMEGDK